MNKAYLLIGGNLGRIKENLAKARAQIEDEIGSIEAASSLYQTAAWGLENQPDFLNQVLLIYTEMTAEEMLGKMLRIEQRLGRIREIKNGPRVIDIDLLFFNDQRIDLPHLKVPHPLLHTRNFTLFPLFELAPDLLHPVLNKTVRELLAQSPDTLPVQKLPA
ncbi:2-amino-4-hydroxy-6-hydroxymethyldihydropteridine diphosphokinase [Arachidicoccus terrestris]|uniref:2-amino-4-hydroxy-6- hydroxymethyldihydropteridine diphosphokinase n=1 Tax=Arachidicoccus terrestris TaxID=2875539 RepID=UPI001CC55EEA|nr:2-amino-4-hydroxy-6-hydroxymethyldihydropteridine diphosphokinase [Arachidicoccus terrestris]UAY54066.1 2-amino-4-hydroxy-6-hydroxymethyldihydropteridine diphosphokinase [Arachidicoccus terrestris]